MTSLLKSNVRLLLLLPLTLLLIGAVHPVPPKELRGRANAACRSSEPGPAVRLQVQGLKDRMGKLRIELYPANDQDFLAADKELIAAGKIFKRVEMRVPAKGKPTLCIRAPAPGRYAVALLHDRDSNGKFGFMRDGVAFPGNPKLGRKQPPASVATVSLGAGVVELEVKMQYLRGVTFSPIS